MRNRITTIIDALNTILKHDSEVYTNPLKSFCVTHDIDFLVPQETRRTRNTPAWTFGNYYLLERSPNCLESGIRGIGLIVKKSWLKDSQIPMKVVPLQQNGVQYTFQRGKSTLDYILVSSAVVHSDPCTVHNQPECVVPDHLLVTTSLVIHVPKTPSAVACGRSTTTPCVDRETATARTRRTGRAS